MIPQRIRTIAIGLFRRGEDVFVVEGYDETKKSWYYRPPGGGVEFCERGEDALRREIREELETDVSDCRLLSVVENIFTCQGDRGHEIVFVYEASFKDAAMYGRDSIVGHEDDGSAFTAHWKPPAFFDELHRLVPEVLAGMLHTVAAR